jgi:hypothetical protein
LQIGWLRGTTTIDELDAALAVLIPICHDDDLHATLPHSAASCWGEVGRLNWELGERAAAIAAMERARTASPTTVPEATAYAALWSGDVEAAARQFSQLLAGTPTEPSKLWWERRARAELLLGLGQAQRQANRLPAARSALRAATSELAAIVHNHPGSFYERRLGRARVELALTMASLGEAERTITPIAAPAIAWLRKVHSPSPELSSLEHVR